MKYEPGRDAAERYPDWVIRHRTLSHGIPEVMCRRRKVILIEDQDGWPAKRCSLGHAVAHLDLGHTELPSGVFEHDQEVAAVQLAARRLITIDALAGALSWTRHATEVAEELVVDMATLMVRKNHMHPSEVAQLRRKVRWLEETA